MFFISVEETSKKAAMVPEKLPEFHPKNIVELEKHIAEAANEAVKAYYSAVCATKGKYILI